MYAKLGCPVQCYHDAQIEDRSLPESQSLVGIAREAVLRNMLGADFAWEIIALHASDQGIVSELI